MQLREGIVYHAYLDRFELSAKVAQLARAPS